MCSTWHKKFKLSPINQIVEALVEQGDKEAANQATIILMTALICADAGIEAAMKYYNATHNPDEYVEFMTEAFVPVCGGSDEKHYTGKEKEDKCTTL